MGNKQGTERDEKLWADFLSGNDEAFRVIYDSHVHHLFSYGCHFTSDEGMVQDCIHDLFLDLHGCRSRLGANNNIRGYLLVSLRHKIIHKMDQRKKQFSINMENVPFDLTILTDDPSDTETEARKTESLQKALLELPDRQREAIYLRFVAGLNYDELCSTLHVNYQVARNLVYRGMEKLRESIKRNLLVMWLFTNKYSSGSKKIKNFPG
jgi:RNA polymerase sigma factor (sigma-70 family)